MSCVFYSYGPHRDLHSFPTRRSSNLFAGAKPKERTSSGIRPSCSSRSASNCRPPWYPVKSSWRYVGTSSVSQPTMTARGRSDRSEEHTSELQSRRDLVCRLLLEKKKK